MDCVELGDLGADKELTSLSMDEVGSYEHVEVGGAAQGAAASRGGGEPE